MVEKLIGYEAEIMRNDILSVQINLLNRCTSRCVSCKKYTWPPDELNIEDVKNVVDVLVDNFGLKTVVLSGGDPILYEELEGLVEYLNGKNVLSSMITTGIVTKMSRVNIMADIYRIHVSLDACTKAGYERIRGVNAFGIVDKNIKMLSRKRKEKGRMPVRLSSTISKLNYDRAMELYNYAKNNDCNIKFFLVHTFGNLYMEQHEEETFYTQLKLIVEDEKKSGKISNASELLNDRGKLLTEVDCKCYVPCMSCVINANGDIYPCCRVFKDNGFYGEQRKFAYGNIVGKDKEDLFREFSNRLRYQYPLVDNEECKNCGQRYQDLLQHLCKIKEPDKREVLFI